MIIDLTPHRDGTGPARLLDMVEGRSKQAFTTWLAQRCEAWRDAVEVVAMDGFPGYKTATAEELPKATAVMDPFHVARLTGDPLDKCRRRAHQAIHGHRGMKSDPLYRARRTLHTGAGLLTEKQKDRLTSLFTDDAHVGVEATWGIYQRMIAAYREEDHRGFSTQSYYKWLKQPVSAREAEEVESIAVLCRLHEDDPEGGYRVLADDLAGLGYTVSQRRAWRLCRIAGIRSAFTRKKARYKRAGAPVHDDLVKLQFTAEGPNQLWLTDITEHRTREGKLYPCSVKDVFSNRIVGYSTDSRMKARIAVDALEMAVAHRGLSAGVIVHSDRGS